MAQISDYFPYPSYRQHQREMLEAVAATAETGGILMIDAPTGSGKSSVIAPLLAKANGKKILVAVRTTTQLNIFINELNLIRKEKKPDLTYAYILGRGNVCPYKEIYPELHSACKKLKEKSGSLMNQAIDKGYNRPEFCPEIKEIIANENQEEPTICPAYIHGICRSDDLDSQFAFTPEAEDLIHELIYTNIPPDQLIEKAGSHCPYELMKAAAIRSDVIILNYVHILPTYIRPKLYKSLHCQPENIILLFDEAHNVGETILEHQSVTLTKRNLERITKELTKYNENNAYALALLPIITNIQNFMNKLMHKKFEEDTFSPQEFESALVHSTKYNTIEDIMLDVIEIGTLIEIDYSKSNDYREPAISKLWQFLYRFNCIKTNSDYLPIYLKERKSDLETEIKLKIRYIDPADILKDITDEHYATIFISGTLQPLEEYKKYYFRDKEIKLFSSPNVFPEKNRCIIGVNDVTSVSSRRTDPENNYNILTCINSLDKLPGNIAVYFPSYAFMYKYLELYKRCKSGKKIIVEPQNPKDRDEAARLIQEFCNLPKKGDAGILFAVCGGKWSEGLDFKGEMLTGVLVIGHPLSPFTEVRRKINALFDAKFHGKKGSFLSYDLPAINKSLQAFGRVLRTESDTGVLILAETRYTSRFLSKFPGWVNNEMKICSSKQVRSLIQDWIAIH